MCKLSDNRCVLPLSSSAIESIHCYYKNFKIVVSISNAFGGANSLNMSILWRLLQLLLSSLPTIRIWLRYRHPMSYLLDDSLFYALSSYYFFCRTMYTNIYVFSFFLSPRCIWLPWYYYLEMTASDAVAVAVVMAVDMWCFSVCLFVFLLLQLLWYGFSSAISSTITENFSSQNVSTVRRICLFFIMAFSSYKICR